MAAETGQESLSERSPLCRKYRPLFWLRFFVVILPCISFPGFGQIVNTATMDTLETTVLGHVAIGGYVDSYWNYNLTNPRAESVPYAVSSARNNEMTINLAYVDLRYRSHRMRARFVPGFGTYMNDNYANETGTLKHLVEANVGILLSEKRKIWVDAGVLGSPYTNESAVSKDHLMYTRSLAPENVPYYLSGIKVSVPVSAKVSAYLYLLNGWQVIEDNNRGKSVGTQVEIRPAENLLFDWNTYWGDERSAQRPDYRTRLFSDVFMIFKPHEKWDVTSCFFAGRQNQNNLPALNWWQVNLIARYHFTRRLSLSGRIEYFDDPKEAVVTSANPFEGFSSYTTGGCLNVKVTDNALFRMEVRHYFAPANIYEKTNGSSTYSTLLSGSLTAWF